jgi:hypothetical protein
MGVGVVGLVLSSLISSSLIPLSLSTCHVNSENSIARIAIGFFGMSRSLNYTYPSINRHIFQILQQANISYDIFWSVTISPSRQHPQEDDQHDLQLMKPCRYSLIDQNSVRFYEFEKYYKLQNLHNSGTRSKPKIQRTRADFMWDNYDSIKNILCAYKTLQILNQMISSHAMIHEIQYDAILIIRPDCAFINDLDLPDHRP